MPGTVLPEELKKVALCILRANIADLVQRCSAEIEKQKAYDSEVSN